MGEAWPITDRDKKIVLKEDPEHHRYVDVTSMIKIKKYQNVYGYYEYDGWMDQKTKIRVFYRHLRPAADRFLRAEGDHGQ